MKKLIFIVLLYSSFHFGQKLDLSSVVNSSYSDNKDIEVIKGKEIAYIVPNNIGFIKKDLSNTNDSNVLLYANAKEFLMHLKKVNKDVSVLKIVYDNIDSCHLDLILEINTTNFESYNKQIPFLIYEDKRKIRLKYSSEKGWVFERVIKIYDEPHVGDSE